MIQFRCKYIKMTRGAEYADNAKIAEKPVFILATLMEDTRAEECPNPPPYLPSAHSTPHGEDAEQ
jgi:hypothetical protein